MNLISLLTISSLILFIAYFIYGSFLERRLKINPKLITPAHTLKDNVDYVPAKKPILLGHHFATIAGGGPIVGPITAIVFGWLPALLWVILGSIFIGGVHDYTALQASIRHKAKSVGEIIKQYMGEGGQVLFLLFAISAIILVVGVFIILIAITFEKVPQAATASLLFLLIAILFGFLVNILKMNIGSATIFGIAAMMGSVWLGMLYPISLSAPIWSLILIAYAFVASVLPVWILLQPRDYLNAFLLYGLIIGAAIGIFMANPVIQFPSFTGFYHPSIGYLFPVLFITIACGAVSGFHSLVASGTTSKQLDNERDGKLIAYGSMLMEALLAIIAISSVAYLTQAEFTSRWEELGGPIGIFSAGIGHFISHMGIAESAAIAFTALVASAFLLTSLDSITRLGRYTVQELTDKRIPEFSQSNSLATIVILVGGGWLAFSGTHTTIWPIFGAANQMLAGISLLAVSIWFIRTGLKPLFTIIPMFFMFMVTMSALGMIIYQNITTGNILLACLAAVLLLLCMFLAVEGYRAIYRKNDRTPPLHV